MRIVWIKTDKHVFGTIYREHKLKPFSSCTCPDGDIRLGKMNPYIYTSWGFEDSDAPLLECIQTIENHEQKEWDYKYSIALIVRDEDDEQIDF